MCKDFKLYKKLVYKIEELIKEKEKVVIAIEGNCGSGKTTLANYLQELFSANLIQVDDFFLPLELRTKERLNEIGGNVHYERFMQEVIIPILHNEKVRYRKFDCHKMDYVAYKELEDVPLTIIEGTYSMRKEFQVAYDYKILMNCDYDIQLSRILKRSNEAVLQMFVDKWIPLENYYFENMALRNCCDICIETGKLE